MSRWPQKEYSHDPKWVKSHKSFRCQVCNRRVAFKPGTKKPKHPISRCPGTDPNRPRPQLPWAPPIPPPTSGILLVDMAAAIIGQNPVDLLDELTNDLTEE